MSYIIKNCPCYEYGFCTSPRINEQGCRNCTDCLLKQIADKCKRAKQLDLHFTPSEVLSLIDIEGYEE